MANKTTVALTLEEYQEIIKVMRTGGAGFRANERMATCLMLEANLGLRIKDILKLRLCDIIKDGNIYRFNIVEQKSKKKRTFTIPIEIYQFIYVYCSENNIAKDEVIFPITERTVQKYLKKVSEYLGYENIGTHSFRKFFSVEIYDKNDCDIELVRELLQHSSTAVTRRYLRRSAKRIEDALQKHIYLM